MVEINFSGNEGEGVPDEILDQCNINIHIKPHNTQHLDSLNVSVATGLYNMHMQYAFRGL